MKASKKKVRLILSLAVQVAAEAPRRRNRNSFDAKIPWSLITELREALDDAGFDWLELLTEREERR